MSFILRYKLQIIVICIGLTFFSVRLPNLTYQPIFADEAIYIRWAQVMKVEPTLRFLPLQDGKTPLFMWAMMPLLSIFKDPLFAGRFLSVLSGLITLAGVYFLGKKVFGRKVGITASLLYAVTPYTVFFDRMALVDSMLAAFTIWIIYLAISLIRKQSIKFSVILGLLLGGATLVKTPATMNFLILPLSIIGFTFRKLKRLNLVKLVLYWGIAIFIGFAIYNTLRVDPNFYLLSSRNADYVISPQQIMQRPLDPLVPHLRDTYEIFTKFLTWPVLIFILAGIVFALTTFNRLALVILIWAMVPIFLFAVFLKPFTARYLLLSVPPFLVLAGFGLLSAVDIVKTRKVLVTGILILSFLIPTLRFDYLLLTNIQNAPLPKNEREGYLEEWTAGYGFSEIAEFVKQKRKEHSVVIGTEGFFGTLPEGLRIYLDKADIPFVTSNATVSAQIRTASRDHWTYFVANKNRLAKPPTNASLIKEYPKAIPWDGGPQDAIVVYQVFPE